MYDIQVDSHVHSIYSGHAYGTIEENIIHAKEAGMRAMAITDHFSPIFTQGLREGENPESAAGYVGNLTALPRLPHGVLLLHGIEIDIVDFEGHLAAYNIPNHFKFSSGETLCERLLLSRDVAIASVHGFSGSREGTVEQNTALYVRVLQNPLVQMIGHPGRSGLPFDIDTVLETAASLGKIIEVNEHSFDFPEAREVCVQIARRCAQLGVYIAVNSDAHSSFYVGRFPRARAMLREINFPESLVANLTPERFLRVLSACGSPAGKLLELLSEEGRA